MGRASKCGLAGAESLFDQRQVFVAIMHHLSGGGADRQVGFENVTAVQSCSLIQGLWIDC
ncbi:MAG: hypothetical protein DMG57_23485 [Acidobacteria bacterium]|nr:MAG: hypothetical protein DMG57_23485 [Acidobacteriota bacterium]